MSEEYLTVKEAAEKLSVSPRTIQRYCKQGRLNHKWVQGKRHKELRIIPPISFADLPGVKHRALPDAGEVVTADDFERYKSTMESALKDKDRRLHELEQELAALRARFSDAPPSGSPDASLGKKLDTILYDIEKVRPVEKKLILKLADEVKKQAAYLQSLGMENTSDL